jgi:succinoglycan biosynthesis protein ExoA
VSDQRALPSVSIIIAARPDQAEIQSIAAARKLDYPPEKIEIVVARGKQPSVQRNAALRAARHELIYFLDDDSIPLPQNLTRAARHFIDPNVKMVGGPNLCPNEASPLEKAFALTMASPLAFGPSAARYRSKGSARESSEKELILCNLMARRDLLVELGGFDESLYPNEENALMDEAQRRGGKLLHDPDFIVWRRPRSTVKAFVRMLFNYGRGRAEQLRAHPTPGSLLNLAPPLFLIYLAALPFLPLLGILLVPYGVLVALQALLVAARSGISTIFFVAAGIVATHIFYGAGFWAGLFRNFKKPRRQPEVALETVQFAERSR